MVMIHTPPPGHGAGAFRDAGLFGRTDALPQVPKPTPGISGSTDFFTPYTVVHELNVGDPTNIHNQWDTTAPWVMPTTVSGVWLAVGFSSLIPSGGVTFSWQEVQANVSGCTVGSRFEATWNGILGNGPNIRGTSGGAAGVGLWGSDTSFLFTNTTDSGPNGFTYTQSLVAAVFNSDWTGLTFYEHTPPQRPGNNRSGLVRDQAYINQHRAFALVFPDSPTGAGPPAFPNGGLVSMDMTTGTVLHSRPWTDFLSDAVSGTPNLANMALIDADNLLVVDQFSPHNMWIVPIQSDGTFGFPAVVSDRSGDTDQLSFFFDSGKDQAYVKYGYVSRGYPPSGGPGQPTKLHTAMGGFYDEFVGGTPDTPAGVGGASGPGKTAFLPATVGQMPFAGAPSARPRDDPTHALPLWLYTGSTPVPGLPPELSTFQATVTKYNVSFTGSAGTDSLTTVQYGVADTRVMSDRTMDQSGTVHPLISVGGSAFGTTDPSGSPLWVVGDADTSGPNAGVRRWYVTAGEQRSVLSGSHTDTITFGDNIDIFNNSFDFGSFPSFSWQCFFYAENTSWACADLNGSQFAHMQFFQSDLSYANLTNTTWGTEGAGSTTVEYCSLAYADCTGATFGQLPVVDPSNNFFDFTQNDCTGTNFTDCTFINVNFVGGGFIGANFTGARFLNCTWTDAAGVDGTVFWDSTTRWPAGFSTSVFPRSRGAYFDFSNQTPAAGTNFSNLFFGHANFQNAVLLDIVLPYTCCWADFSGSQLLGGTFGTSRASYPMVSWANLRDTIIDFGTMVNYPSIVIANGSHADFTGAQFVWEEQSGISVGFCAIENANLAYANFNGIKAPPGMVLVFMEDNCAWCTFVGAELGPTNKFLWDGTLPAYHGYNSGLAPKYTFPDSCMAYADFTGCVGGYFSSCDLSNAKFIGANIPYSDFNEAYIGDADFTGARVSPSAFYGTMTDFGSVGGLTGSTYTTTGGDISVVANGNGQYDNRFPWCAVLMLYTSWTTDPLVVPTDSSWHLVGAYGNAQSGGKGWLGVYAKHDGPTLINDSGVPVASTITFHTDIPSAPANWQVMSFATVNGSNGVRDLQFSQGAVTTSAMGPPGAVIPAPTVPSTPKQNGMFYLTAFFSATYPPGLNWGSADYGPSPDTARASLGSTAIQWVAGGSHATFMGYAIGESPGEMYMHFSVFQLQTYGIGPWIAVSLGFVKAASIPAFFNSGTILPPGIAGGTMPASLVNSQGIPMFGAFPKAAMPALTSQTDPRSQSCDNHQDFSHQTIDAHADNFVNHSNPPRLGAFGADFNHAHFTADAVYNNLQAYNSNFQGCTFDPGTSLGTGNANVDAEHSHWGGTPADTAVPRGNSTGIPGYRAAWRVP